MKRAFTNAVLAVALTVCGLRLDAQAAMPPAGERVRIDLRNGDRVSGRVVSTSQDTLHLQINQSEQMFFTRQQMQGYAFTTGRDLWKGAGRGAVIGGVAGLALIVAGEIAERQSSDDHIIGPAVVTVPAALLITGLGAGLGALFAPETWSPQIQLGIDTRQDAKHLRVGLALSHSVGF